MYSFHSDACAIKAYWVVEYYSTIIGKSNSGQIHVSLHLAHAHNKQLQEFKPWDARSLTVQFTIHCSCDSHLQTGHDYELQLR